MPSHDRSARHLLLLLALLCVSGIAVPSCNIFTDFGNAECNVNNNVGCATGGSPSGLAACVAAGASLWECNVVDGPNTVPIPVNHTHPGMCGSFYCASSLVDAQNQSGAAGDPSLTCVPAGLEILSPWTSCITPCNPCDDGQGGTLQSVAENCGGTSMCCQGLTCVGAGASTMGVCQGTPQCATKGPVLMPLTTMQLRAIAAANNIGVGQSGVTLSRTIGIAFETWVLATMGQLPRYKSPLLMSPLRAAQNNGLPGSVLPEFVGNLNDWFPAQGWSFTNSMYFEVKAVTGVITLSARQWQALGLIDVASQSPADAGAHPPHALVFTTTGNTNLGLDVLQRATTLGVAIWQQIVMYDANTDPNNPDLYIDQALPANQAVYGAAVPLPMHPAWPHSPLVPAKSPPEPVADDPDPPEVD
jgi:hypothetical protein